MREMEKEHSAVLVVDILNDFVTGALGCERARKIVAPVARLCDSAREHGIPVIFCDDSHLDCDREVKLWGPHAMRGTKGAEVVPEIGARKGDYVVRKRSYSGFFQTDLDLLLKDLGVKTVIITGLQAHLCVQHTAADAYQNGYDVVACTDGMESFTQEDYDRAVKYIHETYGAELLTSDELIKIFSA